MLKRLSTICGLLVFIFVSGWQLVQAEPVVFAKQQKAVTENIALVGNIEAITPTSITLEGQVVGLTDNTIIEGELELDAFALVEAIEGGDGSLTAVFVLILDDSFDDYISLVGEVGALDPASITVEQQTFLIDDETIIEGELAVGAFVYLEAVETDNGSYTATYIEVLEDDGGIRDTIEWVGIIETLSNDSLTVSGLEFAITESTVISGDLALGLFVYVEGEGGTPNGNAFTATYIEVLDDNGHNGPLEWFGIVDSFSDTEIVVDGQSFAVTPNTQIEGELAVGEFVFVLAVDNGDGSFTAEIIEVLEDDGGWGDRFEWFGTIESYDGTNLMVDGFTFAITPETEIIGELAVGEFVFVLAEENPANGTATALLVEVLEDDGSNGLSYIGQINEYEVGQFIVVDDLTFLITDETEIIGNLEVGGVAFVHAEENDAGEYIAVIIEAVENNGGGGGLSWFGEIEAVGENEVTIAGVTFVIDDATLIEGELVVGELALVEAIEDGEQFLARLIIVLEGDVPNEISVVGTVVAYTTDSISVENETFAVTDETEIVGEISVGETVYLLAELSPSGEATAVYIEVLDQEPDVFAYTGFVTAVNTDAVVVDNLTFAINDETEITGELAVGEFVFVLADVADDGSYTATYIEVLDDGNWSDIIDVVGHVTDLTTEGLTLNGDWFFFINDETEIEGELAIDANVYISAEYDPTTDTYTALYIDVLEDDGGNGDEPVVLLGVVASYTNDELVVDGTTLMIDETTEIVGTLAVGEFVFVVALPHGDTRDLLATYIEVLDDDGTPPSQGVIVGEVTAVSDTNLTVEDMAMEINDQTVVIGNIEVGTLVYAEYEVQANGQYVALFVESLEEASTTGAVESMSANQLVVDGQAFQLDGRAQVEGRVTLGTDVYVGASQDQSGNRTARLIRALDVTGGYTIYLPMVSKSN